MPEEEWYCPTCSLKPKESSSSVTFKIHGEVVEVSQGPGPISSSSWYALYDKGWRKYYDVSLMEDNSTNDRAHSVIYVAPLAVGRVKIDEVTGQTNVSREGLQINVDFWNDKKVLDEYLEKYPSGVAIDERSGLTVEAISKSSSSTISPCRDYNYDRSSSTSSPGRDNNVDSVEDRLHISSLKISASSSQKKRKRKKGFESKIQNEDNKERENAWLCSDINCNIHNTDDINRNGNKDEWDMMDYDESSSIEDYEAGSCSRRTAERVSHQYFVNDTVADSFFYHVALFSLSLSSPFLLHPYTTTHSKVIESIFIQVNYLSLIIPYFC
jgi:hypothetical protein